MKYLIQVNLMGEQWLRNLKESVEHLPHEFVGVIPFSRDITANIELTGADFIPYGSTLFTNLAYEKGWKGLHFDLETFNYGAFLHNRDDMLNGGIDTRLLRIESAVPFLRGRPHDEKWFIRPSQDLKQFSGTVDNACDAAEWLEDMMLCESTGSYKLDASTQVLLATPAVIDAEWRYFVVGGKIISGSMYRAHGQPRRLMETDREVLQEAQSLADKWLPDPCCVMDLALVDGAVKVIEFNCINSSGFYEHDIKSVLDALYNYHV